MSLIDLRAESKIGYTRSALSNPRFNNGYSLSLILPSRERSTLSDLMSRWMTPLECKCCSPCNVCFKVSHGYVVQNCLAYLSANCRNLPLSHHVVRDHVSQTAAFHELHDNPKIALDKIAIHEIHNVLVLALTHDENFVNNQIFLGLLLQVHLLDRNAPVGITFDSCVHSTRCTLTDLVELSVEVGRIHGCANLLESCNNVDSTALSRSWPGSWSCIDPWLLLWHRNVLDRRRWGVLRTFARWWCILVLHLLSLGLTLALALAPLKLLVGLGHLLLCRKHGLLLLLLILMRRVELYLAIRHLRSVCGS
jgi:hypothetical protein